MATHHRSGERRGQHRSARGAHALIDRGSATLTIVLLTPVFVVIAFAAFQAALWTHARTEIRAAARDAAVLVARFGAEPEDVVMSTTSLLEDKSAVAAVVVQIPSDPIVRDDTVVVYVTAVAPGIIVGTEREIGIVEALPIEGFRP